MKGRRWPTLLALLVVLAMVAAACGDDDGGADAPEDFQVGMILVGPQNDRGWSQAHFEAGLYVMDKLGLSEDNLIVLDKMNTSDRPETTIPDVVADMIDQGADVSSAPVLAVDIPTGLNGIEEAAAQFPDVPMIWSSGDNAWEEGKGYRPDLANLGNIMGRMEYGKAMAGCAAAMTTQTGNLSYLGPLINDETRRLVNSAYLGARYCYENYVGGDPDSLGFEVKFLPRIAPCPAIQSRFQYWW